MQQPMQQAAHEITSHIQSLRGGTAEQKQHAARALGNLAFSHADKRGAIAQAGGIPPLVAMSCEGTAKQKQYAAFALGNLALNHEDNARLIAQAGGIPQLVVLSRDGTEWQKQWANYALSNLAFNHAENVQAIEEAGGAAPVAAGGTGGMGGAGYASGGAGGVGIGAGPRPARELQSTVQCRSRWSTDEWHE